VLDTDKMLEEKYRISVYNIFEKYGEDAFRKLEYNILIEALQHEAVVIATGGGASCFSNAMELINDVAYSIYLELSPKSLTQRLLNAKVIRPLTKNKSEEELLIYVTEQLAIREPFYKQAHYTIKGENFNLAYVNMPILQYLTKKNVIKKGQK
jgi:shikimate kinase